MISEEVKSTPEPMDRAFLIGPRALTFLLFHVPLALAMHTVEEVASIHAWTTIALSVVLALKARRVETLLLLCAYVAGCEVLWRMNHARVFWETGKYLTSFIAIIGLLRFRSAKSSAHPALYFALLIPGAIVTLFNLSPGEAKDALSFNLSGPFAFTICSMFLSRLWIAQRDLQKILFVLIGPVAGVATLTIYATLTATQLRFTGTQSIMVTSGGFGPNQVSAILGLAALFCFLIFLTNQSARLLPKIILLGAWGIFTLESALTYSRGGIYMEFAAIAVASYYSFKERTVQFRLLFFLCLLSILAVLGTIPYLDSITSGTFSERYSSVDPTGRDSLILDDLRSFSENPFFGLGAGRSAYYRTEKLGVDAHTEYTRLLGDHGMFGFFACAIFIFLIYRRWRETEISKPTVVAILTWGLLFLGVYAMRLVAPVLMLAIPMATMIQNDNTVPKPETTDNHRFQPRMLRRGFANGFSTLKQT